MELVFAYVTVNGDLGFDNNNRDGRMLLPDTGKPPAEAMAFYRSQAKLDEKTGTFHFPELRQAKHAGEFYAALDALRHNIHCALGTRPLPPRQYTPEMIALAKKGIKNRDNDRER